MNRKSGKQAMVPQHEHRLIPSALLPLAMSLAALTLVLGHAAVYGVVHDADEGAAAHIWQILMAGQIPFVAYFMFKWLVKRPKESLLV